MKATAADKADELPEELNVLVPFWGLAGGVIKILDYARHASRSGVASVRIWAPPLPHSDHPVHALPVLEDLHRTPEVRFDLLENLLLDARRRPWVLFTEPGHLSLIEMATTESLGPRLIHLVQGTRHANPEWNNGLNYRVLHRPMSRIAVTTEVADAIKPHVNPTYPLVTVVEGHDCAYFAYDTAQARTPEPPLRVLYATWKSDLGDRIAASMKDESIVFDAIRTEMGWPQLRSRYKLAHVFLCTPGPEEGFYLPGLEAMAAGCAVVSSFVGGNEAYLVDGENVIRASYESVDEHVEAIRSLAGDPVLREKLIGGANRTTMRHSLERESEEFESFLYQLARATDTEPVL